MGPSKLLAPALAALVVACGGEPDANLILISIDTLRADRLSVYGYERPTSPQLERFADEAVVFERFYQNGGTTLPSHMTLMTSLRPGTHQVDETSRQPLAPEHVTLAERLAEAGFRTAAFVDDGWLRGEFGFARGFERYDDTGGRFAAILPKATQWLREHGDERFFLFLHSYDVHAEMDQLPYHCPGAAHERYTQGMHVDFDGCRGELCAARYLAIVNLGILEGKSTVHDRLSPQEIAYVSALYDGCIHYVDAALGRFFDLLRELGIWDRTLVVVTSDHGEEFAEHGLLLHEPRGYEEIARVPLLLKLPSGEFGGRRVQQLGALVDVMPTLLEALALPPQPGAQGVSLLPAVRDGRPVRDAVSLGNALRTRRWKWIGGKGRLYDLEADPGERSDLFASQRARAQALSARLADLAQRDRAAREALGARGRPPPVKLDAGQREELRALGYLE